MQERTEQIQHTDTTLVFNATCGMAGSEMLKLFSTVKFNATCGMAGSIISEIEMGK